MFFPIGVKFNQSKNVLQNSSRQKFGSLSLFMAPLETKNVEVFMWLLPTVAGYAVAQVVEGLCGFDFRWSQYSPGVNSATDRNEYQG